MKVRHGANADAEFAEYEAALVDVALTGPLPKGARPDLTIDSVLDLEVALGLPGPPPAR